MTNVQVNPASVPELAPVGATAPTPKAKSLWGELKAHYAPEWAHLDTAALSAARAGKLHGESLCRAFCAAFAEFLVTGSARNLEGMIDALAFCPAKEQKALHALIVDREAGCLRKASVDACVRVLTPQNAAIRAIICPPAKVRASGVKTNWKAAYGALHAHCVASGFTLPTGIPTP